jgi:2-dehydropantoate 2-reductase
MKHEMKNICIVGVGGIGGYFGGLIAYHANQTADLNRYNIYFVARGKHLETIKRSGLQLLVENEKRYYTCKPAMVTASIDELPVIDVFFYCHKKL